MKPSALLVNVSRGAVIETPALIEALKSHKIGGAALDVFDHEPLTTGSPLAGCPNLILTPHIAGVSHESNQRVSALIVERVTEALLASARPRAAPPRT